MADGFLGRWSQRKQAVREGKPLVEPPAPVVQPGALAIAPSPVAGAASLQNQALASAAPVAPQAPEVAEAPPTLSLDDVKALTAESDYAPYVSRAVSPEVRNAAMKKLFTDPHYNVMDRLDIYIDDYSLPDPLPASMLRQMASAKFLKLFEEDPEVAPTEVTLRDDANTPAADSVAQSSPRSASVAETHLEKPPTEADLDHDHTDLRLQPNDAAGPPQPGRSTE